MAEIRFEVRVPADERAHHAAWKRAADRERLSLSAWAIRACNQALTPAPAPRSVPVERPPVPAAPFLPDPWWEAGLWAGRIERAFDGGQPDAIDWMALRGWARDYPEAAARLDAWGGRQHWGPRWAAAFHRR